MSHNSIPLLQREVLCLRLNIIRQFIESYTEILRDLEDEERRYNIPITNISNIFNFDLIDIFSINFSSEVRNKCLRLNENITNRYMRVIERRLRDLYRGIIQNN